MKVKDVMTRDPACCSRTSSLEDVAKQMVEHDCGCIPVVNDHEPIGMITDRDIVTRAVAAGKDIKATAAGDCMTSPCVTIEQDSDLEDCCNLMEARQLRRIAVVDESGRCCGIVAQADIARREQSLAGEVVKAVSQPGEQQAAAPPA